MNKRMRNKWKLWFCNGCTHQKISFSLYHSIIIGSWPCILYCRAISVLYDWRFCDESKHTADVTVGWKNAVLKDFSLKDTYNSPLTKIYLYDTDGKRYVTVLEKSLIFNRYRVFWSLEVTSRMHVFDAYDSLYSYSADLNYGKIYVYDKNLQIWKQIPFLLILLVVDIIAEDYAYYKKKHANDWITIYAKSGGCTLCSPLRVYNFIS